ncbi:MAG: carboxypeptidase regulatory-like domain-containing protein [Planctomycetales bacterium]|nr:carboxypeptidase regulatory-like domain-containing protein [Planctomycetales bacterium]
MIRISSSKWILLGCLSLFVGCGEADKKVPVEGLVMCDGKPIEGASVAFIGNNGGAYGTGVTNKEGKFWVRAAEGKNKVAVSKANTQKLPPFDPNADQSMPTEAEAQAQARKMPKPLIADRFSDPDKSGIEIDVIAGMSPIDISVTSQ